MYQEKNINDGSTSGRERIPRPDWLKIKPPGGENYSRIRNMMRAGKLHTVCEEAHCPNINECWSSGTATFMILGDKCTRNCRFCAVVSLRPAPPDPDEPQKVAVSVREMGIKHVVITSVTRDDLPDGGAGLWAQTITKVKELNPDVTVEVLIPDFKGKNELIDMVLDAGPDIFNHNVETVPGLYKKVRPQAKYDISLQVLEHAKKKGYKTKTGLMAGLGETNEEIISVMKDLRRIDTDIITIGQYLQPSRRHLPVAKYLTPDEFRELEKAGLELGFEHVESAPLVRSSYHAEKHA